MGCSFCVWVGHVLPVLHTKPSESQRSQHYAMARLQNQSSHHFRPLRAFPPSPKYGAISEQLLRTHVGIPDAGTSL